MLVIAGYVIVVFSVFGGFALAGGHLAAMFQPIELLMIGGAALGAFFVGNPAKTLKATAKALPSVTATKPGKSESSLAHGTVEEGQEMLISHRCHYCSIGSFSSPVGGFKPSAPAPRFPSMICPQCLADRRTCRRWPASRLQTEPPGRRTGITAGIGK